MTRRRRWIIRGVVLAVLGVLLLGGGWFMLGMPGRSFRGPLPAVTPQEEALRDALRGHVEKLAGEIGERNVFRTAALEEAAQWIEAELTSAGYEIRREEFSANRVSCRNVVAEIPGTDLAEEIVVVGAHYDSVFDCPGANDNGTGVAALLELAKLLKDRAPRRTLRWVAFVNEEPPFFQGERMGSLVHAKGCRERGEHIVAMLSLETIGYYRDEPGSQGYPFPFSLFYPGVGNFIGFVGNLSSRKLVRECVRVFRETTQFPSEGGAIPEAIPGVGWSDHWSFWQYGYPGLMVTDTAPFRYPHYHEREDTPDKIDYERMARVVSGLGRVVAHLAGSQP